MELFNMLNLCIDNKDVTFVINQNIARHYIPNLVLAVSETPIFGSLFKTKGCHVGVNHNLCGRVRIGDSWLNNNRLDSATIESCKAVERISGIWDHSQKPVLRKKARKTLTCAAVLCEHSFKGVAQVLYKQVCQSLPATLEQPTA